MSEDRYIAAIEISSSKIIGAIGRAHADGQVDIIAVEQEKCTDCVRYGIIQNLEETYLRLARVCDRLEHKPSVAPRKIKSVFVGLSGRSLRSIPTSVRLTLPDDTEITDDTVSRLRSNALASAVDSSLEVIDAVPRCFTVGHLTTENPRGVVGNEISGRFDLIVCRPDLKRNIIRVVKDKLNIDSMDFVVTPLATGHLLLSEQEKALGCMLVDLGAETTTVSIYRDKALCYLATIPLGGRHITRDLQSRSLLEDRAEELKITSGCAIAPERPSTLNVSGLKMSDVINLTVARSEEIVANISEQLVYADIKESEIPGGVICIGGGIILNGMTELLSRRLSLPVKSGYLPSFVQIDDLRGPSPEIVQVASILYAGATMTSTHCLEQPRQEELPATGEANEPETEPTEPEQRIRKRNSFIERVKRVTTHMFSNPEAEDSSLL